MACVGSLARQNPLLQTRARDAYLYVIAIREHCSQTLLAKTARKHCSQTLLANTARQHCTSTPYTYSFASRAQLPPTVD